MGSNTKIEWTEATWNPVRGCSIVSEGCRNCYAMRMAHRSNRPGGAYEGLTRIGAHGPTWTGDVRVVREMLDYPLKLRKPHRIFVNSMSDLFHESLDEIAIGEVFGTMAVAEQHTFQVLTKRPGRMKAILETARVCFDYHEPLANVWLGVSAEDQKTADERIPLLMETPAAVRWVSAEPLLGPIDLESVPSMEGSIDWVVVGGESGPGARPMHPDWARSLRDQCKAAGVPFFFKQWGKFTDRGGCDDPCGRCVMALADGSVTGTDWVSGPDMRGAIQMHPLPKHYAGNILDGRWHLEYPA